MQNSGTARGSRYNRRMQESDRGDSASDNLDLDLRSLAEAYRTGATTPVAVAEEVAARAETRRAGDSD